MEKPTVQVNICGIVCTVSKYWKDWVDRLGGGRRRSNPEIWGSWIETEQEWRDDCKRLQDLYRRSEGFDM